jgi:hypothetical protein
MLIKLAYGFGPRGLGEAGGAHDQAPHAGNLRHVLLGLGVIYVHTPVFVFDIKLKDIYSINSNVRIHSQT